jgi:hypothetical protein
LPYGWQQYMQQSINVHPYSPNISNPVFKPIRTLMDNVGHYTFEEEYPSEI